MVTTGNRKKAAYLCLSPRFSYSTSVCGKRDSVISTEFLITLTELFISYTRAVIYGVTETLCLGHRNILRKWLSFRFNWCPLAMRVLLHAIAM